MKPDQDFPYAESTATRMLADALANVTKKRKISLRTLAKELGYKQSVVLSHMASGRVPIPLERVSQYADVLELPQREFARAVLLQRQPEIDWFGGLTGETDPDAAALISSLELSSGETIKALSSGQLRVIREVAADRHAERRWLSIHEVPAILLLRELWPEMALEGIPHSALAKLRGTLACE